VEIRPHIYPTILSPYDMVCVNGYSYFQLHRHPVCHLIHNIYAEKSVILAGGRISTTYVSQEFGALADGRCG